ncbi:hypothetical protein C8T65DRAFT_744768 [Cerioporus squamosus]|nr:hypothetical protein C8T65DRAFT_744768 [Cerioporus squamosus]
MPEVPLRAKHAPPQFRKMMYSFHLENFSIHDGNCSAATQLGPGGITSWDAASLGYGYVTDPSSGTPWDDGGGQRHNLSTWKSSSFVGGRRYGKVTKATVIWSYGQPPFEPPCRSSIHVIAEVASPTLVSVDPITCGHRADGLCRTEDHAELPGVGSFPRTLIDDSTKLQQGNIPANDVAIYMSSACWLCLLHQYHSVFSSSSKTSRSRRNRPYDLSRRHEAHRKELDARIVHLENN